MSERFKDARKDLWRGFISVLRAITWTLIAILALVLFL
jgi:hypothetical protein